MSGVKRQMSLMEKGGIQGALYKMLHSGPILKLIILSMDSKSDLPEGGYVSTQ